VNHANQEPAQAMRVLLAKPGLDGHDRGVRVIAQALRDAGMEVIYLGMRVSPRAIALAAVQEDVHAIGISNLSGAYRTLFPEVANQLKEARIDLSRVVLFGGGTLRPKDREELISCGFRELFGPETSMGEVVAFLEREVQR
jgi:methylmalonyl-CoA mutase C-terminal domain/subunit